MSDAAAPDEPVETAAPAADVAPEDDGGAGGAEATVDEATSNVDGAGEAAEGAGEGEDDAGGGTADDAPGEQDAGADVEATGGGGEEGAGAGADGGDGDGGAGGSGVGAEGEDGGAGAGEGAGEGDGNRASGDGDGDGDGSSAGERIGGDGDDEDGEENEEDPLYGINIHDELLESLTNEALIEDLAAKIEGFDDDFRAAEMSESDEEENFDEQDLALDERILEAKRTWESLMEYHRLLERRLVQYLVDIKRRGPGGIPLSEDPGSGVRFQATLREWQGLRDQKSGLESSQDAQLREMQQTLADKRARAEEARQAFQGFVMEVAQSSEYSRTGKPIPPRLLQDLSGQTRDRANELTRVRLRWVQLRSHLARLEETLRSKEELAEGLHLIDFEQLKIENQALNEKIEERTEELSRLQRKSMAAVLVLTHVKEKLQFVEQEAETLTSRLEGYESALGGKREELHAAKVRRDRLRMATMRLKEHKTTVSSQMLLEDLGQHRARLQDLQVELEGLKRRHGELSEDTKARQEELTTLKSRAAEMAGIAA